TGQGIGIPFAVPALVMRANNRDDGSEIRNGAENGGALDGVRLHDFELVVGQRPWLPKDRVVDANLANIVPRSSQANPLEVGLGETNFPAQQLGVAGHAERVAAGVVVP